MRTNIIRFSTAILLFVLVSLCPSHLFAALSNGSADLVLGQADYTHNWPTSSVQGGLNLPASVAIDNTIGRVYVADYLNNRVLWWNSSTSLVNGQDADGVLGQPNFISYSSACTQSGMFRPAFVSIDRTGNVWIADSDNNRVLKYARPTVNGPAAILVLGQPNFTTANREDVCSSTGIARPFGVSVDSSGNVWVADTDNNRVLKYTQPSSNGQAAVLVLGQPDFTTNEEVCSSTGMTSPGTVAFDSSGNVWVSDVNNCRVLKFVNPSVNGQAANLVLGQSDFTSNIVNCTQTGMYSPIGVALDSSGNVWAADMDNSRVLKFTVPSYNGQAASKVLGQPVFYSSGPACSQIGMTGPYGVAFDNSGNVWVADSLNNRVLRFSTLSIASITPNSALNTGPVAVTNLAGAGFLSGTIVKLSKTGYTDINAANINIVSESKITCTFDLTGQAAGYWDVVASTGGAGSLSAVLHNGFLITANTASTSTVVDPASSAELILDPPSGQIKIDIPAGTFGQTVTVTLSTGSVPSTNKPTIKVGNICIEISNNLNLQPNGTITITMHYNPADISALGLIESKLAICRYDTEHDIWIPIPFTLDTVNHVIYATIDHFSTFVLVQLAAATNLDSVKVYPNPFNSNTQSHGMTITNLTASANIKIYNVAGELIRTLNYNTSAGSITWDGKNDYGKIVTSGVYIIYINAPEGTKKIKVAIEK